MAGKIKKYRGPVFHGDVQQKDRGIRHLRRRFAGTIVESPVCSDFPVRKSPDIVGASMFLIIRSTRTEDVRMFPPEDPSLQLLPGSFSAKIHASGHCANLSMKTSGDSSVARKFHGKDQRM
jgi:hypothetical protein